MAYRQAVRREKYVERVVCMVKEELYAVGMNTVNL
jgi:hypothetical protein